LLQSDSHGRLRVSANYSCSSACMEQSMSSNSVEPRDALHAVHRRNGRGKSNALSFRIEHRIPIPELAIAPHLVAHLAIRPIYPSVNKI
jgi:hypothetical protein